MRNFPTMASFAQLSDKYGVNELKLWMEKDNSTV